MWAKIKKSINSTLGTENFKPLDEIVRTEAKKITDDLLDGSFVVNKSKNDQYGRRIDSTYYSLAGGEHMKEITRGSIHDVREAGTYFISWSNWHNGNVTGFPTDSNDGKGSAILKVELDKHETGDRVYQTLRFINTPSSNNAEDINDIRRKRNVIYVCDIDWNSMSPNIGRVVSPWRRLISAEEVPFTSNNWEQRTDGEGWYYLQGIYTDGKKYNFGLVFWDGYTDTFVSTINYYSAPSSIAIYDVFILADGNFYIRKNDMVEFTDATRNFFIMCTPIYKMEN